VNVPVAFTLPDGSVHEPARVRLCVSRRLNPVTDLCAVRVDGVAVGMFPGRRIPVEESDGPPYLTFLRNRNGELVLIGLTRPPRRRGELATTVVMAEPASPRFPPDSTSRYAGG